jgi:hypothetical protein
MRNGVLREVRKEGKITHGIRVVKLFVILKTKRREEQPRIIPRILDVVSMLNPKPRNIVNRKSQFNELQTSILSPGLNTYP